MGFDASKALAELTWNFRPYVQASGVTPEPSQKLVRSCRKRMRDAAAILGRDDFPEENPELTTEENQEAMLRFIASLDEDEHEQVDEEFNSAIAELTRGRPSKEDLSALQAASFRHYRAYLGSLMRDVLNPEV